MVRERRSGRLAALLLLAAPGWTAAADMLSLRIEPSYGYAETRSTDETGKTSQLYSSALAERLTLGVRKELLPLLGFYGDGYYENADTSTSTDGRVVDQRAGQWNLYGRLSAGDAGLNGGLDYTSSRRWTDSRSGGITAAGATLVRDSAGAFARWRPDFPLRLELRLLRSDQHDVDRVLADTTTYTALGTLAWDPSPFHLFYRLGYDNPTDNLQGVESRIVGHALQLSWSDRFLDGRVSASADYQGTAVFQDTVVLKPGATIPTRVAAAQGLSGIEALPATSTLITLSPNPGLIDGDTGSGAGLDIGFGPSLAGDTDARAVGAQLLDPAATVNTVYLWVDRQVPATIAAAFAFTVWKSSDNVSWAPVALTVAPSFDLFQNRFQIGMAATQARYLKVSVKPLAPGVTLDQAFRSIAVTELQLYDVEPADQSRGSSTRIQGVAGTSLRAELVRSWGLSYDFIGTLVHRNVPSEINHTLTNGLTLERSLSRVFSFRGRLERTDAVETIGRTAATRASARLGAQPFPTLGGTLGYQGEILESPAGRGHSNTFLLFGRAEPYRGIGLAASGQYALGRTAGGQDTRTALAQVSSSIVPHPTTTLTATFTYSGARATGGGLPDTIQDTTRLEGSLGYAPFQAFNATAGGAIVRYQGREYHLANLAGSLSPFPGGDLILTFQYNEALDTLAGVRSRLYGPYLRWNLRGGAFLESSLTSVEQRATVLDSRSLAFNARLMLPL